MLAVAAHSSRLRTRACIMANPNQSAPVNGAPSSEGCVALLRLAGGLKRVERTGWLNHGVVDPESVSDHCHRMAVACVLASYPGSGLDWQRYVCTVNRVGYGGVCGSRVGRSVGSPAHVCVCGVPWRGTVAWHSRIIAGIAQGAAGGAGTRSGRVRRGGHHARPGRDRGRQTCPRAGACRGPWCMTRSDMGRR